MPTDFYRELLDALADGVYFVDADRRVTYWNKAAERISGYSAQEILGKRCADNFLRHVDDKGTHLCIHGCPLAATISDGELREADIYMHHKFGHRVPVSVRATPIRDEDGTIIGAVEIFTDNSKQQDLIKELETVRKEVLSDALTGIGNRRFAELTMAGFDQAMRESNVPFGILMADIDHFKAVNDTWGHHVGDLVLAMVARTLSSVSRRLDVACRWGGEEFVVLIPNTSTDKLTLIAERLRMLVENSWLDHAGELIKVTISMGGAVSMQGEASESVLKRADRQLYVSKDSGRNCVHIE